MTTIAQTPDIVIARLASISKVWQSDEFKDCFDKGLGQAVPRKDEIGNEEMLLRALLSAEVIRAA